MVQNHIQCSSNKYIDDGIVHTLKYQSIFQELKNKPLEHKSNLESNKCNQLLP